LGPSAYAARVATQQLRRTADGAGAAGQLGECQKGVTFLPAGTAYHAAFTMVGRAAFGGSVHAAGAGDRPRWGGMDLSARPAQERLARPGTPHCPGPQVPVAPQALAGPRGCRGLVVRASPGPALFLVQLRPSHLAG